MLRKEIESPVRSTSQRHTLRVMESQGNYRTGWRGSSTRDDSVHVQWSERTRVDTVRCASLFIWQIILRLGGPYIPRTGRTFVTFVATSCLISFHEPGSGRHNYWLRPSNTCRGTDAVLRHLSSLFVSIHSTLCTSYFLKKQTQSTRRRLVKFELLLTWSLITSSKELGEWKGKIPLSEDKIQEGEGKNFHFKKRKVWEKLGQKAY